MKCKLLQVIMGEVEGIELSKGIKIQKSRKFEATNRGGAVTTVSVLMGREASRTHMKTCVYCNSELYSASCKKIAKGCTHKKGGRKVSAFCV